MKALLKMFSQTALLVAALSVLGCGPGSTPVEVKDTSATATIKQNLQSAADTGQMGSEMMAIDNEIDKLATTDPEKAAALKKDFEAVKKASGPAQVKAKAKEMMGKL